MLISIRSSISFVADFYLEETIVKIKVDSLAILILYIAISENLLAEYYTQKYYA